MGKYILCIDNGLTTTKSVIFTTDGKEIASSLINTVVENYGACAEIDMELQWKNTAYVIKESIKKSNINPSDIVGVGNSGHGAGLYCLDKVNKPVRKAVSSMDARAIKLLEEWDMEGKSSYKSLFQNLWSGQAIPILTWLKRNEPDSYKKIEKIFMVKDWIIYKLTGNAGIEYTDASNSGLLNPITKNTDKEVLKLFGIEEMFDKLPPLRKTTDIAGYVTKEASIETGLNFGTTVTGGVYDVIACALGSGVFDDDKYSLIAGTWNVNTGIREKLVYSAQTMKCSLFVDIDRYIYVESSATSAVNLEWFIDNVLKGIGLFDISNSRLYKIIDEKISQINAEESNIIYMPFLYKSQLSKNMEGSFFGIKAEHNVFNMLRALFEGVAFAHLMHIESLRNAGVVRNKAVLSGGATNSHVWCQIFSDILNMEIITTEASQVGALGTAVCTAIAIGEYNDFKKAIGIMVKDKNHYYPDAKRNEVYMRKYKEFRRVIDMFDKVGG
ncbi:L-xylulokinase [Anaerobacterium chartisolvens]|uniref:L-xylulokinase n=1 Tax=Anaerobacterium chartisolvens TaxID=1297424 RepID=A0A369B9L5_9FIRM|nr:FGGY-family carbohydrate kinase [Anaerobacterium chartisolvens]RCX18015.1 L-xylulokinase [Anaerobacterium chartisolvens]